MIEFTGGCSVQYKSKTCMGRSSLVCGAMGYKVFQRNYFETSHAKRPQDAAGGLLERQLDLAVLNGNIIQNAQEVCSYAAEHLHAPKSGIYIRRIFKYIPEIDRSENYIFRAVENNRQVHQLTTTQPGRISVRNQSCYTCDNCLVGESPCQNICKNCSIRDLDIRVPEGAAVATELADDGMDEMENTADFITEGDTVAVVAADENDDYFLLKVTRTPYTLRAEGRDDRGNTFPKGARVVGGYYYKSTKSAFKNVKRRKALVYLVAVCYILDAKDKNGSISVDENLHQDILKSLNILDVW